MYRDDLVFEVTANTRLGSFALRPCAESTELILGVIGRALYLYPSVRIHALNPISTHLTLLASVGEPREMTPFISHVKGNISKEIKRLHELAESIFEKRRASVLPVSPDQASEESRLSYVLSQGTKEDLVESPREWSGVTGVHALEHGDQRLYGWWFDRTAESKAAARGERFGKYDYATRYEVPITPLPSWGEMTEEQWRARATEIVDHIAETNRARRLGEKKSVLGVDAVEAMSPEHIPAPMVRTPSPVVLAATKKAAKALRAVYDEFCNLFTEASRRSRLDPEAAVEFPPYSFPPGRPMTPGPALCIKQQLAQAFAATP